MAVQLLWQWDATPTNQTKESFLCPGISVYVSYYSPKAFAPLLIFKKLISNFIW